MSETRHAPLDLVATDGTAFRRGYLELILDEQHCTGSSGTDDSGSPLATLTLYLVGNERGREIRKDSRTFATRLPLELVSEQRKTIMRSLMDQLIDKYGLSSYTDSLEEYEPQLETFSEYVKHVEPSWFQ